MKTEKYKGYTIQVGGDLPGHGVRVIVDGVDISHEFEGTEVRPPNYPVAFAHARMAIDAEKIDEIKRK